MTTDLLGILIFLSALGAGLIAGLFFAFSVSVMGALARIPAPAGIAAMQAINVVILNPLFGFVFFGTLLASLGLSAYALAVWAQPGAAYLLAGGVLYAAGGFGVTMVCNVPRNNALMKLDPTNPDAAAAWATYVSEWTSWNHVRMLACLAASAAFIKAFSLLGPA
jgi:uncharacterized membrane protein